MNKKEKIELEAKISLYGDVVTGLFVSLIIVLVESINYFLKTVMQIGEGILYPIDAVILLVAFLYYLRVLNNLLSKRELNS